MTSPALARGAADPLRDLASRAAAAAISMPMALVAQRSVQRFFLLLAAVGAQIHVGKRLFYLSDGLGSSGGFDVSLTTFALAGLYSAWLVELAVRPGRDRRMLRSTLLSILPAALFLLCVFFSLFVASNLPYAAAEAWDLTEMFLVLLYAACRISENKEILLIFRSISLILILESVLIIGQGIGLLGEFNLAGFKGAAAEFAGQNRPSGTFGAPNNAAGYLAAAGVICLGNILAGARGIDRFLAAAAFLSAIPPLALTLSRGGWFGFIAGTSVLIFFLARRTRWKTCIAIVTCLGLAALPFAPAIAQRILDDDGSAEVRMGLNKLALRMILDHPVLGVGINNFATAMGPYRARGYSLEWSYAAHNVYLLVCSETGVFGLIAFLWLTLRPVYQGIRDRNGRDKVAASWGVCCAAAIMTYLVQGAFEPATTESPARLAWLLIGLAPALVRIARPAISVRGKSTVGIASGFPE